MGGSRSSPEIRRRGLDLIGSYVIGAILVHSSVSIASLEVFAQQNLPLWKGHSPKRCGWNCIFFPRLHRTLLGPYQGKRSTLDGYSSAPCLWRLEVRRQYPAKIGILSRTTKLTKNITSFFTSDICRVEVHDCNDMRTMAAADVKWNPQLRESLWCPGRIQPVGRHRDEWTRFLE